MSLIGASKIFETDAVPFLYSTQKLMDVIIHFMQLIQVHNSVKVQQSALLEQAKFQRAASIVVETCCPWLQTKN